MKIMVQEYKRYAIYVFLKIIQLFLNSFAQTTISSVIAVYAKIQVLLPFEEVSVEANKEARAHIYFPMDPNNTNFHWSDTAYRHVNLMNLWWRLECQWDILLDCLVQDFMAWSALSHPERASSIDERSSSHVFDENSTSHAQKSSLAPTIRCSCFITAICLIRDPWSRRRERFLCMACPMSPCKAGVNKRWIRG